MLTDAATAFNELGYAVVRHAIPVDLAEELEGIFWARMASRGRLPWARPLYQLQEAAFGQPCRAAYTQAVLDTVSAFVASAPDCAGLRPRLPNDWLGWWLATFPGHDRGPWTPPRLGWHFDGGYDVGAPGVTIPELPGIEFRPRQRRPPTYRMTTVPDRLVLNFMITDSPDGTGTSILPGSHLNARAVLAETADGLHPTDLQARLTAGAAPAHATEGAVEAQLLQTHAERGTGPLMGALPDGDRDRVVHVSGERGDLLVLHPLVLHATSRNVGDAVRIVTNPWAELVPAATA